MQAVPVSKVSRCLQAVRGCGYITQLHHTAYLHQLERTVTVREFFAVGHFAVKKCQLLLDQVRFGSVFFTPNCPTVKNRRAYFNTPKGKRKSTIPLFQYKYSSYLLLRYILTQIIRDISHEARSILVNQILILHQPDWRSVYVGRTVEQDI